MPVEFLSDAEAAAYCRFDGDLSREDLDRVFFLDDARPGADRDTPRGRRTDGCACGTTRGTAARHAPAAHRELRKDSISRWRWFLGAWGVGTSRTTPSTCRYEADGEMRLRHGLPIVLVDDEDE